MKNNIDGVGFVTLDHLDVGVVGNEMCGHNRPPKPQSNTINNAVTIIKVGAAILRSLVTLGSEDLRSPIL